jgi:predicted ATP-dependent endonuclease of OLD family
LNHIRELYIKSYRGIRNLKLDTLGQFNLLLGKNNFGKTSVLEAIELIASPGDIGQFMITSRGRDRTFMLGASRLPMLDSILWVFPVKHYGENNDVVREHISLNASVDSGSINYDIECKETYAIQFEDSEKKQNKIDETEEVRALEILLNTEVINEVSVQSYLLIDRQGVLRNEKKNIFVKTKMVTPVDHRVMPVSARALSRNIMTGDKNNIIKLLQDFDENIEGIELLAPDGNGPVAYFKHKTMGFVPITVYGDGVRRILTIANAILQAKDGLLLIDEVETAIHAKLLQKFFDWLVKTCKEFNVQLFATTHSLEAIDAILSADKENLNELTTYRLEKNQMDGTTFAKRFIGDDMYSLRYELGQDVR